MLESCLIISPSLKHKPKAFQDMCMFSTDKIQASWKHMLRCCIHAHSSLYRNNNNKQPSHIPPAADTNSKQKEVYT